MDPKAVLPTPRQDAEMGATTGLRSKRWGLRAQLLDIRKRVLSGLVFALPIVITFWIMYWILMTFQRLLLNPLAVFMTLLVNRVQGWMRDASALNELNLPDWWFSAASPLLALLLALLTLYALGLIFRSWLYRTIDWTLLHVPVVATIYKAVRNVVDSVGTQFRGGGEFKRVVLVAFPHPGMRSLALVTNTLQDVTTGRTILTVCLLTGVMPPSGFTLFVPEEDVTNIDWNVNETLQAVLSGGLTSPSTIHYFQGLSTPVGGGSGPILDSHGRAAGAADEKAIDAG
jgi:uncharacterized membrane protein